MDNAKQDAKNVNNSEEKQKDSHDLQVLNTIGSILAQMATNDPNELRRLVSQTQGLKSDNAHIQALIERVASLGTKKQEAAQERINAQISQEAWIEFAQQARNEELQIHKDIIEQKHNILLSIKNNFPETINKLTDNDKVRTKNLKNISAQLNQDIPIDKSELESLVLSQEEMDEIKKMYAQSKEINNHYKEIHEDDKNLQAGLKSLNEKLKDKNLSSSEKQELMKDLSLMKEKIIAHEPLVSLVDKMYEENQTLMALRQEELKKYGQAINEFGQIVKDKYPNDNGLKNHHAVLKEQHNEVEKEHALIRSDLNNNKVSQLVSALTGGKTNSINLQETKPGHRVTPSYTVSAKLKNDKDITR